MHYQVTPKGQHTDGQSEQGDSPNIPETHAIGDEGSVTDPNCEKLFDSNYGPSRSDFLSYVKDQSPEIRAYLRDVKRNNSFLRVCWYSMRSAMLAETEDFVIQFNPYATRVDWFLFKTGSLTV